MKENEMAKLKGTTVASLKNLFKMKGLDEYALMKEKLSPELYDVYLKSINVCWAPIEQVDKLNETAADILFPGSSQKMFQLGCLKAEEIFQGIYKIILPFISVKSIMERHERMFKLFHETGTIKLNKISSKHFATIINDYPEMPPAMVEMLRGFIYRLIEMAGEKNVKVTVKSEQTGCFEFDSYWD
jgi:hypothetical protein